MSVRNEFPERLYMSRDPLFEEKLKKILQVTSGIAFASRASSNLFIFAFYYTSASAAASPGAIISALLTDSDTRVLK